MPTQTRVLITGAAGRIGSFLTKSLAGRYTLTLADIRQPADTHGLPFLKTQIADLDSLRAACGGVEVVVHLAADPSTEAGWESLLPNNIIGVYNAFQAAHEAGCRRVIFASTVNVVSGYPPDVQVHPDMPVRPPNLYGASKAWGEAVARYYADQHGLSAICLRFGAVTPRDNPHIIRPGSPFLDMVLTLDDLARLVVASIEAPPSLRFGIFHGVSNNRHKRLDITSAREQLGYAPEDDAFALAEARGG